MPVNAMKEPMTKPRTIKSAPDTRRKILRAVGKVLAKQGMRKIGINHIAQVAGVDKVLIYRYFGGMAGLLKAYSDSDEFWPSREELLAGITVDSSQGITHAFFEQQLRNFSAAIRKRTVTQEILRWELIEQNAMTRALDETRERQALELIAGYQDLLGGADSAAIIAILSAGLIYLTLRSQSVETFNGIDLKDAEGWKRIEDAACLLLRGIPLTAQP
jgi:AcrR family transcriptional regulator